MKRQVLLLPVAAATLLALAACSGGGGNNPFPTTGSTTGVAGDTSGSSSGGGGAGGQLAAVQPCSLLSSSVLSENKLAKTKSGTDLGARYCSWQTPTGVDSNGNVTGFAVEIDIRDSQGLSDINTSGESVTDYSIGGRQGKQVQDTNGGGNCFIAIPVTSGSRVDVVGTSTGGTASDSCSTAVKFAQIVVSEIPGGSN